MFDSPFLSDGSKPLRGTVLTYTSLVIIALSLIYFVCALGWEIKTSRRKKKTKRQIMWSKLKGFKHKIVEPIDNWNFTMLRFIISLRFFAQLIVHYSKITSYII